MPTLGLVMIVKNESQWLPGCLDSVQGICDEMIVGDTGSTDETASIARSFGAQTLSIPWSDDFAAARNAVLRVAAADWLLHLDADERLDPEGAGRLSEVVRDDGGGADAIELVLANYSDDPRAWRWVPVAPDDPYARGHAGYISAPLLRLFRNRRGYEYREPIHENITESVLECGGRIRSEPIIIHHYGYPAAGARREAKARMYLEIAQKKAVQFPRNVKALHDYAEQALACGLTGEAEAACRRILEIDVGHLSACLTLANILLNRGDLEEAWRVLEGRRAAGELPPLGVTALAAIDYRLGRLAQARAKLDAVLVACPDALMARLYLARVLDAAGDSEGADQQLERAVAQAPRLLEPRNRLEALRLRRRGERLMGNGDAKTALAELIAALQRDPEDPFVHLALSQVLQALGEVKRALESGQRARRLAPWLDAN